MTEVQFAKQFLTTLDSKNTKYQADHVFDPKTFQTRIPYTLPKLSHPPHPLPPKSTTATTPAPGSEPAQPQTQTQTINLTLKSTRNPTFTLHLPSLPQTTTITSLKQHVQNLLTTPETTIDASKIKILHAKKPIPPSKATVHDVLAPESGTATEGSEAQTEVEFGVMILGGAKDPIPQVQSIHLNAGPETQAAGPDSENATVEAATGLNPADAMKGVETEQTETGTETETQQVGATPGSSESEAVQPAGLSGRAVWHTKEFWVDLQGFLEQRLRDVEEAALLKGAFARSVSIGW